MVNRARRQFVAVIMGILLIVFFCMGAAIILTAETTQKEKIKNMLNPFDTTAKFNGYRRFVLGCSWSGTFVVDANAGNLFTADEIENIFRFIYERENFSVYLENPPAHGTESWGEYEDYFYRINFVEDGFLICVIDGSPAQAAAQDSHRRLRAVIRLHGVGAELQLHVLRRADERLVRRGDEARVSGVPAEGERHAERTQQHAPPHRAAQEKPERPEHQHNARRRKPQRGREKILRRDAAERKGGAEAKERARHGSSFSPSR